MAKTAPSAPLTFDLDDALAAKIESCRARLGLASTSEVVRLAISKYAFDKYRAALQSHRQVSVRLTADMRGLLRKQSRAKGASIGELLRAAIASLADSTPAKAAKTTKPAAKKRR